jgi:predicted phage terminase large subunit-like protein
MISQPNGNESHFITIARELMDVFKGKTQRLMINVPPGWGKSTLCQSFIAWCFAHYADCRFLYISHSFELAAAHTHTVKKIMQLPEYKLLFNVNLRHDQSAKDFFETTAGGAVAAFGAKGGITGRDAGLPGENRFTGGLLIDDIHKPEEVHSDTIREKVRKNYFETMEMRLRGYMVPIIFIGQMLHEDDLPNHLLSGADGQTWRHVKIKGLDDSGNARYPEVMPLKKLLTMKEKQPYVFASQIQQEPIPSGGALFKQEHFEILDEEPNILYTFISVDSSETEKTYNDATAMSFWGLYQLKENEIPIDMYALHWIDCIEVWVEPKDLEETFLDFYSGCMRHDVKPTSTAIEKKSTGTTLLSLLRKRQGLHLIDIERTKASGTKTDRYLEMQPYIASRQLTLPKYGKHTKMCIEHMTKITANQTHARDDICDTAYDAVKIALINKFDFGVYAKHKNTEFARKLTAKNNTLMQHKERAYGNRR